MSFTNTGKVANYTVNGGKTIYSYCGQLFVSARFRAQRIYSTETLICKRWYISKGFLGKNISEAGTERKKYIESVFKQTLSREEC
jgi:hypothetical protein